MMSILQFLGSPAGRWTRIVAGLILVLLAVVLGGWGWILAVLGAVFIAAGSFDFCLLAPLFGKPLQGPAFRKAFTS
ncbi:YgaP-like transmembrane domain [Cryobacterium sp. HLT2-28]|uniref:YgaP-like transmembrane domain n=1 Tax=Cryobacterium sp. HLT2-28 TaxID=1259146 RepID=UPI001A7EEC5B|nr:YgaP-like transmembrane domain [Cryobacterium sp. HLT2-28]